MIRDVACVRSVAKRQHMPHVVASQSERMISRRTLPAQLPSPCTITQLLFLSLITTFASKVFDTVFLRKSKPLQTLLALPPPPTPPESTKLAKMSNQGYVTQPPQAYGQPQQPMYYQQPAPEERSAPNKERGFLAGM
jgi:hypothetical protein